MANNVGCSLHLLVLGTRTFPRLCDILMAPIPFPTKGN